MEMMGNTGKQDKDEGSQRKRLKTIDKVCLVCGDRGYYELLIYCSECSDFAVHQYCLGLVPGSISDPDKFYWACEKCRAAMGTEPTTPQICGAANTMSAEENCMQDAASLNVESSCDLVIVEDQPEPLQILMPDGFDSRLEQERENINSQYAEETQNLASTSMAVCDESPISSLFVEIPKAIMSEVVLVVSPSGEITIHATGDDEHGCNSATLGLMSSIYEISSETLVQNLSPSRMKSPSAHDVDMLFQEEDENRQYYSPHNTDEQGLRAEDACSRSETETIELDLGSDEGDDACYPNGPDASAVMDGLQDSFSNSEVGEHDGAHQASQAQDICDVDKPDAPHLSASADCQPQLPSSFSFNQIQSSVKSQYSMTTLNDQLTLEDSFIKPTEVSSEMSIASSVLDMAEELHETTSQKLDVQVGRYKIKSDLAPILQKIIACHGDIFSDCTLEPDTVLVNVCETVQLLQGITFKCLRQHHINSVRDSLKLPEILQVNVKWLLRHCDFLENIFRQTAEYPALKKKLEQSSSDVRCLEQKLSLKKANPSEVQEEFKYLENTLKLTVNHTKKFRHAAMKVKSLWNDISNKSAVEGLFTELR